jgi:hypothetical protein
MGTSRETMAPVNSRDLDRVVAVTDRLKDAAKALEMLHDVDQALARVDKVISEHVEPLKAAKP